MRNTSLTISSRSLKGPVFRLAYWSLLHAEELAGDLPVSIECHILMLKTIKLQLSDAITDISMPQHIAHFQIPLISIHFVADDVAHELATTFTLRLTLNNQEEDIDIRYGWTPKE